MKHIRKRGMPREYKVWWDLVRGTPQEHYHELQNPEKRILHSKLIEEQGKLCAYTMKRIDLVSSHIEHVKPETLCRAELVGSDLDYENLVACFPREGMKKGHRYGAQMKGAWWENDGADFISPLHPSCEKRFQFHLDGCVSAVKNHVGAKKTIEVLKLNHDSLIDDRKRIISEFLYGPNGDDPLPPAKALQAKAIIGSLQDSEGGFYEFCIAIHHALDAHQKNLQKAARQRKFARKKS